VAGEIVLDKIGRIVEGKSDIMILVAGALGCGALAA